jgi:hypothetical protein
MLIVSVAVLLIIGLALVGGQATALEFAIHPGTIMIPTVSSRLCMKRFRAASHYRWIQEVKHRPNAKT